ncbi:Type I restriction-modification system, restriction subunit R [Candidatus Syntrophocurvum alkaliphilum]|uniref:Type I restriction-modification system, restriction subunit R n=1 Tax=Candidatus Syntrophocurvum alkaliphilum TaxID=2293317 RepID=A0A6I6DQE3_9FIRM|nr:DEAD/DEAH box helicase family protein [Candidatus Syntrophocurvum alkaliphilum]QGU00898.1 Type I restriction-modification system, restriction subunit R [Candidatus Syntrophocurvum alkaliphilum]
MSNFSFLENNSQFNTFTSACMEAEKSIAINPAVTAILSRRALELAVKWVYEFDGYLTIPYQDNLSSLIHNRTFQDIITPELFPLIKYIVKLGNNAAHTANKVTSEEAVLSLHNLHQFVSWMDYCYSDEFYDTTFNEEILPTGQEQKVTAKELENLYDQLGSRDKKLKDAISENEKLREELKRIRETKVKEEKFHVEEITEFTTRKKYIDLDLKDAGWVFSEDCLEEYPVIGMPSGSGEGYVDYVLFGDNGKPLAVVEAKRTSKDPRIGEQQAKLYADCLENSTGQRPVIFYTNGFETYIWDDYFYPARRVAGFYSKEELQLIVDRRKNRIPLNQVTINEDIINRYYQKEAVKAVCESLDKGDRKTLLVMATGSGKTRTAVSIVDLLTRYEWAKNILFLADRTALVRQAKNSFNNLLTDLSLCNLLDSKDNPESRMIFSTYPTMMNAIDETKSKTGQKLFTVGHFDLIIIDEAHRSIYKKYQAIFDYFDAILLGLTATPKDDIDINTYNIFDLENNVPTYAYELEQAVTDGYLVPYNTIETKLKFLEEGISYDDLSEEEKEQYEETFEDDMPDHISGAALNSWLFNHDTIDIVLTQLMEKGIKVEGGDKLGKTIIFAKSHKHAVEIVKRFDKLYPEYKGQFARVIDHETNYSTSLIEHFSAKNKMPQIAVSVDMLDTGIDIPEIVNLVFFKKVRSKAKFWQMIGRGTRLCEDLFGPGLHKERFYIFDFCGNFEFFRVNARGKEIKQAQSLTEKIFNIKVDLIKELQHLDYQEQKYIDFREKLITECVAEIKALNKDNFVVKQYLKYIDQYSQKEWWDNLGVLDVNNIKENIAPLITSLEEDELAKRFDYLMFTIELAQILGTNANKGKQKVMQTANTLSELGTIPQVLAKKDIIDKVREEEFWESADLLDYEMVREALRDLIKFIEKNKTNIYYTNFTDEILEVAENEGEYGANDFKDYKKKVNKYIRENQSHLAIHKLRTNKQLSEQDFKELEKILWNEVGSKEEYDREFGDTPLTILVREIIGLDQQAANEAFSEFLTNENLDSKQIRFVKTIVDYVVRNGHMLDKKVLQEEPFSNIGSITELFPLETAKQIVSIIDGINKNATEFVGA